jgi:hypothetical protein
MDGGTKDETVKPDAAKPDETRAPRRQEISPRVDLSYPVQFGEEKITFLEYRKPTAKDIVDNGVPCKLNIDNYEISFDTPKMQAMMATLYGRPPSMLAMLDPRDWLTAAWKIAPFFIPDLGKI